jgi:tetratricopeptide (TPR) repeat protein
MDGHIDEPSHIIFLGKFENNKRYKEKIIQEIVAAICAMLNSNGGNVVIHIDTDSDIPVEDSPSSHMSLVIRILEQSMISIIGSNQTVSNINFKEDKESIVILVKKADSLITTNYNLCLPSQSQVVQVSPLEPLEKVKHDIINRNVVQGPVQYDSHCKIFVQDTNSDLQESKIVQLKHLKAGPSKRTTLADRMTGKGNKFGCYVSAFANHCGGHIYYGIRDDGVVEGELIANEEDINKIINKVRNAINKMIWPEQIGQPKRGEHWEIFFEPVVDENSKPIPSTFVIVIYIAPCLGGVFTEEPECYEMVGGKVKKISFTLWQKRMSCPVWLNTREEIPRSVQRTTWSSAKARNAFTVGDDKLMQLLNDGNWDAISEHVTRSLQSSSELNGMKLLVLSIQVTACYRRGSFNEAHAFLEQYNAILPQAQDCLIFEVLGLYLQAALKRASGDFQELARLLTAALSKADLIEPGLVTAIVYVFAGTVTDLINSEYPTNKVVSPDVLSIRALEHSQCVSDNSKGLEFMKQKAHITLTTFYLGCNISGRRIKGNVDMSDIDKARASIMAVHQFADEGQPLSRYCEVQLNLVLSIYNYRHSQLSLDAERTRFLRNASEYAKKAECFASDYQFTEMVEWSKRATKALCTEN